MPEIIFNGPSGRLEARYTHSKIPNAPLALCLHPDPEQGGTMNNAVVYYMHQAFVARGFSTMRFNFRGVGRSQGMFDRGEGELSDAAAALDWMQEINPESPYTWIGGFQFGSWIGMQMLMRRPEIKGWISIAPPANLYDFTFLAPCPSSGLVLHGGEDQCIPSEAVDDLVEKLNMQKGIDIDYRNIDGANHFFRDHIDEMVAAIHSHMNDKELSGLPVNLEDIVNRKKMIKKISAA